MTATLRSLLPPTTELVRRYIIDNNLQPGDRFPTDVEFAQEIGVGLSSLREAMRTLDQMGVVERKRKTGTILVDPDPGQLAAHIQFHVDLGTYSPDEIVRARAVFEQGLAAEAARYRTDRNLLEMKIALDAFEAAEGLFEETKKADRDFHAAILAAAQNPLASIIGKVIEQSFEQVPANSNHSKKGERRRAIVAEHKAIYESILKKRPERAGKLMYEHIAYLRIQNRTKSDV